MTGQEEYPRFISNRPCGNDKYEGKSQEHSVNDNIRSVASLKDFQSFLHTWRNPDHFG